MVGACSRRENIDAHGDRPARDERLGLHGVHGVGDGEHAPGGHVDAAAGRYASLGRL